MPRPRSAMRQIREVLRLSLGEGLSPRQIRDPTGLGRATVQRYVTRARERPALAAAGRHGRPPTAGAPVRAGDAATE